MKVYKCVKDLQNTGFCVGIENSIERWRNHVRFLVEEESFKDYEKLVKEIEDLPQDQVMDYIADYFQIEFEEAGEIPVEAFPYDSDIASFTLINKNGTKIYLRRGSHSDGHGRFYIFEKERDLDKYVKENNLKLDSFDMRLEEGWKAMDSDCAKSYYNYGIQLHGNFIQIFRKGNDFYIALSY